MTIFVTRSPKTLLVWGVLVAGVALSIWDVSTLQHYYPVGTPEGAASGWWWCLSVSWLAAAHEKPSPDTEARPREVPTVRWYLVAVFSMLGMLEGAEHGLVAVYGFLIGAGVFAVLFALSEVAVHYAKRLPWVSENAMFQLG